MRPRRRIRVGMEQKLLNIQYDYHYETIDADGAKAMLAEQAGLAGRHSDMDACLLLEPIRLIFDRNNRLLEGTDALAHIAGTDCPLEAAIYHERPVSEAKVPASKASPTPKKRSDDGKTLIAAIKSKYPAIGDGVNFKSCAVQLDRYARLGEEHMTERAPLDSADVLDTLSRLDVDHEYELYKFARRLMHRVPNFRAVSAAALMHIQEERTDGKTMMAFWEPLAGRQPDGPQKWLVGQLSEKVGPEEFQRLVTTAWNAWRDGVKPILDRDAPMPVTH